jgi:hypothetical protein
VSLKTHIVVHHSLTKDSGTVSWPAIRRYHVDVQKWSDIGYHLGIEWVKQATDPEGHLEALLGRPLDAKAAAAYQDQMNTRGVHVLFVGNFDDAPPSNAMLKFGAEHTAWICRVLAIPAENIIPHSQVAPYKTCPGASFPMDAFRSSVSNLV